MEGHDESMNADNQGAPSEAASGAREELDRLLQILCDLGGSDLHIKAGAPPRMRIAGALRTLDDEPSFTVEETASLAASIMS